MPAMGDAVTRITWNLFLFLWKRFGKDLTVDGVAANPVTAAIQ